MGQHENVFVIYICMYKHLTRPYAYPLSPSIIPYRMQRVTGINSVILYLQFSPHKFTYLLPPDESPCLGVSGIGMALQSKQGDTWTCFTLTWLLRWILTRASRQWRRWNWCCGWADSLQLCMLMAIKLIEYSQKTLNYAKYEIQWISEWKDWIVEFPQQETWLNPKRCKSLKFISVLVKWRRIINTEEIL